MSVTVRDIERAVLDAFPAERAEAWDRHGLLAGDPDSEVTGVALALDPTLSALASAAEAGANVLVTHHPAFLEPPRTLRPGSGPAGVVYAAIDAGIALINAHTNLDRDSEGQRLLPNALGLAPVRPLEQSPMPMALVTVYAPSGAADSLREALAAAGAGSLGKYRGCSFSSAGTGRFTPKPDAQPAIGTPGKASEADEERVEVVCPRERAATVIAAAVAAHPYEEPLVTTADIEVARNGAALGMICDAPSLTLATLAGLCAATFNITPRVWGDPEAPVQRVVTSTGSAGSLIGATYAAGAQALVAGEVRYHDALDASESGLAIVELGHDVSEWPLVALLESAVRTVSGLDPDMITTLPAAPAWWTTA